MKHLRIGIAVLVISFSFVSIGRGQMQGECSNTRQHTDSYGNKITELISTGRNDHNLYYNRSPWNSDNSYMVGIDSDSDSRNWSVMLYDGRGCFIKRLFGIEQYDWRLVWDRHDPNILYTWGGSNLYRYDVRSNQAQLLKSFAPLRLRPNGPSLNQAGDRILVGTSDDVFHSYHLPDMSAERSFSIPFPQGCRSSWKSERYTGFRNNITSTCNSDNPPTHLLYVYDDTGAAVHVFDSFGGGGHFDFSPDGKLAYYRMWGGGRGERNPLEIHVVNVDGTNDRVVYNVPQERADNVQNLHLSWPANINTWFVAGLFPLPNARPDKYSPPFDEIMAIDVRGTFKYLARTQTRPGRGADFWAQPLASPSADGTRIGFNSNRTGNIQQYILWTPVIP
jgi:hypothetical protein